MPNYFVIKDTVTNLYLTAYSTEVEFCSWGNAGNAIHFDTQQDADNVIATWEGVEEGRFIGTNPPPR